MGIRVTWLPKVLIAAKAQQLQQLPNTFLNLPLPPLPNNPMCPIKHATAAKQGMPIVQLFIGAADNKR